MLVETLCKSGRPDLNRGPSVPQTDALTRLRHAPNEMRDRKSTRLNSSHSQSSYAVFCLKKKTAHNVLGSSRPPPARPRTLLTGSGTICPTHSSADFAPGAAPLGLRTASARGHRFRRAHL